VALGLWVVLEEMSQRVVLGGKAVALEQRVVLEEMSQRVVLEEMSQGVVLWGTAVAREQRVVLEAEGLLLRLGAAHGSGSPGSPSAPETGQHLQESLLHLRDGEKTQVPLGGSFWGYSAVHVPVAWLVESCLWFSPGGAT